ncbi:MAG: aspartate kinase [Bacteroidales bacterium]|nr:aspartate kinase [Bacteroidales bacterium]MDD6131421.1 aspartate kinase [Bacteroidales bacterium]MDD6850936.1 aspartate kinase [Bacteroidales bacterium]MDD7404943.1 aspartate kinase [Bacteroidales bacterium]MDY5118585.1 aspartate kinase [Muribaculaceae bacterium]
MKVMKFGGTSVGSAERIKNVAKLVTGKGCNVVVLSAMSGTTNTLVEISDYLYKGNAAGALETINALEVKYNSTIDSLFDVEEFRQKAIVEVRGCFNYMRQFVKPDFTEVDEKEILSQGELMSTAMMNIYLHMNGYNSEVLPALEYVRTDAKDEPDMPYIKQRLAALMAKYPDVDLYITEGYICRNHRGEVDNLHRGGSDYTASLIGAAVEAEEIQIWTDIDGMHNNDPRFVDGTRPVEHLHFEEAAELAYFGAKILHPTCVLPAKLHNIPVRLLNTLQPEARGTLIDNNPSKGEIKAVAAKDNITAIKIKSARMLLAYDFYLNVFKVFDKYKTPVDMIVTSEVGVSVTIDNDKNLDAIVDELMKFSTVTVDKDMVIVCVVGDLEWRNCGFETLALEAFKDIPVRMISYGGSNYNISFLVHKEDKLRALKSLSEHLF